MAVHGENLDARGGDAAVDEAEDAERGALDDAAHDGGHGLGGVLQQVLGGGLGLAQRNADEDCPYENAQVVGIGEGIDGVGERIGQKCDDDAAELLGRACRVGGVNAREHELAGEEVAGYHGQGARDEGAHDVEADDRLHVAGGAGGAQRTNHEEEDQDGGDSLERGGEQRAERANPGDAGHREGQHDADDHADDDSQDERNVGISLNESVHVRASSLWVIPIQRNRLEYSITD